MRASWLEKIWWLLVSIKGIEKQRKAKGEEKNVNSESQNLENKKPSKRKKAFKCS